MGLLVTGCGAYGFSSRTAKDIKSVAVPFFTNDTTEPNLEITVTERIIDNLITDNTLKVTDEGSADAVLRGAIIDFQNRPFSFNPDLNAEEYRVVVSVRVSLRKTAVDEPIWENQVIRGDGQYFVDVPEDQGNSFEDAVDEAISEITERILNLTVEDW